MRTTAAGVYAAVFAGTCLSVQAQTASKVPESVQIKASVSSTYRLAPQEFASYARPYLLDNGIVIHFYQRRQRYYTQLYSEEAVEVYAHAPGKFRTAQGASIEFGEEGDTIAVTHLGRLPYTGLLPIDPDRVYLAGR